MKKVTVTFGELNIGSKFIFDSRPYHKTAEFIVNGNIKNVFSVISGASLYFYDEDEVIVEVPATFAEVAVDKQFKDDGFTFVKVCANMARCVETGNYWYFADDKVLSGE